MPVPWRRIPQWGFLTKSYWWGAQATQGRTQGLKGARKTLYLNLAESLGYNCELRVVSASGTSNKVPEFRTLFSSDCWSLLENELDVPLSWSVLFAFDWSSECSPRNVRWKGRLSWLTPESLNIAILVWSRLGIVKDIKSALSWESQGTTGPTINQFKTCAWQCKSRDGVCGCSPQQQCVVPRLAP